jgi:hypothetical protein
LEVNDELANFHDGEKQVKDTTIGREMASWCNGKLVKWQVVKMTSSNWMNWQVVEKSSS